MISRSTTRRALCALLAAAVLTGCAPAAPAGTAVLLPPVGGGIDYQLGEPYAPPAGTSIVARDRTAAPAGDYAICYVNAFQTQPGEADEWPPELLLTDDAGERVTDPDWPDEVLIDTRRSADPDALVAIVTAWIDGCADAGSDAVELDNLDTYARSGGVLRRADAVAIASRLVGHAHARGLAVAQKNAAEDAAAFHDGAGFDFAVTEECAQYDECGAYRAAYGDAVIGIEYTDAQDVPFAAACAHPDRPTSLVLRDRDLVGPDDPGYVFQRCADG